MAPRSPGRCSLSATPPSECSCCGAAISDGATCEQCLNTARSLLGEIVIYFHELPQHLGHLPGAPAGGPRGSGDGRPLPGGDVLALLGPGSAGLSDDGETARNGDPVSVVYVLTAWEADWRAARADAPAGRRDVWWAVQYLRHHLRWASVSHPDFPHFVADVRRIHDRLESATGRRRRPERAQAGCFGCGGALYRLIGDDGLEQQHFTCAACGETYTAERYLALLRWATNSVTHDGETWETAAYLSHRLARSAHTLDAWRRTGDVRSQVWGGVRFLAVTDVEQEHARRATRVTA